MTDPVRSRPPWRGRPAALVALLAALVALPARAFDLDALMARLARIPSGEASFVERRSVFQLNQTLESSGRLMFRAPDVFVRETLKPRPDRMAVVGNTLTMSMGGRSRSLALDATPEAAVMIEAIRGTLTGNRALLDRHFEVRLTGSAPAWELALVPRDARLRSQVARLSIGGAEAEVRRLEITLADGDRSEMLIERLGPLRSPIDGLPAAAPATAAPPALAAPGAVPAPGAPAAPARPPAPVR